MAANSKASRRVPLFLVVSLLIFATFASGQAPPQVVDKSPQSATTPPPSEPAPEDSKYVGPETCKTCHEEIYNNFVTTPHVATTMEGKLEANKGSEWHGCEACHGPGKAHVDGGGDVSKIFSFKNATPKETSARCLACHQNREEQNNYSRSAHLQSGVACIDCHSPHHAETAEFLLKKTPPKLCYGCHLDIRAQFARPFHHRVNEGLIQCNDCHNPHGGFERKQLRTAVGQDEVCYKCHMDKQGPFVYQHEAKIEGCTICHSPHGSTNARMLNQNQVNLLCLSCHSQNANVGPPPTPTFHNQAQKYQACTLCHTAIHGSNSSSVFFTP